MRLGRFTNTKGEKKLVQKKISQTPGRRKNNSPDIQARDLCCSPAAESMIHRCSVENARNSDELNLLKFSDAQ